MMLSIIVGLVLILFGILQLFLAKKAWVEVKHGASDATSSFLPLAFYSGNMVGVFLIIAGAVVMFLFM